jgi:DNA-binding transcriptional MerR regulator
MRETMQYTIEELAKAANVSQRSIYSYIQRRLVPSAIREGKGFIYSDEHLEALRLIRVLLKLGLPLRQVEGLVVGRDRSELRQAIAPVLPLAKLLEETENRVTDLQRKILEPNIEELDLNNLGLEDPVALRHNLAEAERQRGRLQGEFESAGADVLRELISSSRLSRTPNGGSVRDNSDNELVTLRLQLETLENKISGQLDEMKTAMAQMQSDNEQKAFIAGLAVAYKAGWIPDLSIISPTTIPPKFANAFQTFVNSLQETNILP